MLVCHSFISYNNAYGQCVYISIMLLYTLFISIQLQDFKDLPILNLEFLQQNVFSGSQTKCTTADAWAPCGPFRIRVVIDQLNNLFKCMVVQVQVVVLLHCTMYLWLTNSLLSLLRINSLLHILVLAEQGRTLSCM